MQTLDSATFKDKIFNFERDREWKYLGDLPAIVDFYADWCGPCQMQTPILEQISQDYQGKIYIYKVNTEQSPELASLFRVRGIPSLLFIPINKKPSITSGFMSKEELKKAICEILEVC